MYCPDTPAIMIGNMLPDDSLFYTVSVWVLTA